MRRLLDPIEEIKALRREVNQLRSEMNNTPQGAQWQSSNPDLTAATTNPTLGTGGATEARHFKFGDFIYYQFEVLFGTGAAAGSGVYRVELPFVSGGMSGFVGSGVAQDASVAGSKELLACHVEFDEAFLTMHIQDGQVSNSAPWTWASGDSISGFVIYEI